MTERELQDAVIECAQLLGWRVAHFRPARVMRGGRETYETPVSADGKGWPDLFMVKPGSGMAAYAIELKASGKQPRPEQRAWLDWLEDSGVYAAVWRPEDWMSGRIERELRLADRAA